MSKEPTEQPEQPEQPELNPKTFVEFMVEFMSETEIQPINILEEQNTDGALNIEVADEFVKAFAEKWQGENIDEQLQGMIEMIITSYVEEEKLKESAKDSE